MNNETRMKLEDEACAKLGCDVDAVDWLTDEQLHRVINQQPFEEYKPSKPIGRPRKVKERWIKPKPLVERFHYDPETGKLWQNFIHVTDGISNIVREPLQLRKNRATGYLMVSHCGKQIAVHRIAWLLMTGWTADGVVYHKNGNKLDNRWSNLTDKMSREVKKYQAQVRSNGRVISLGYFATREECKAAKLFFKQCLTM